MNISKWIRLSDITEEDIQKAKCYENSIAKVRGGNVHHSETFWMGRAGEDKFEEWLSKNHIPYKIDSPIGYADKYDFKINNKIIDVKTSERRLPPERINPDTYKFIGCLVEEVKGGKSDYYLSVMIHKNKAWICGFMSRREVLTYPTTIGAVSKMSAFAIPFSNLHPPREFIEAVGSHLVKHFEM